MPPEAHLAHILARLTQARKHAGLSQSQAAKLLGLDGEGSTISHYENGQRKLHVIDLLKLCELYEVDLCWVMIGVNPNFDPTPIIEKLGEAHEDLASILETFAMLRQEE